jgi:hypothetical protein
VLPALPLFELIEDADFAISFDGRLPTPLDLGSQLLGLLGERATVGLESELVSLRREELVNVQRALLHEPPTRRAEADNIQGDLLALLSQDALRLVRRGQPRPLLIAMNLAEPAKRLESEAEAWH